MAKIEWSELAQKDLDQILQHLDNHWSTGVSIEFIDHLDNTLQLISELPKLFPLIEKKHHVRRCVLTKHNTLYYREQKGLIQVLRIYDTRQNPKRLKL